jgi:hypothetical protein
MLMSSVLSCQLAWFPFLLFDTDWMGREVYQGSPQGNKALANLYQLGVREGALGLLLQSVSVPFWAFSLSAPSAVAHGIILDNGDFSPEHGIVKEPCSGRHVAHLTSEMVG